MNIKYTLLAILMLLGTGTSQGKVDYDNDSIYKVLRDSMSESFNNADEVRFNRDIKKLEDYLLGQNDITPVVGRVAREEAGQGDVYGPQHAGTHLSLLRQRGGGEA